MTTAIPGRDTCSGACESRHGCDCAPGRYCCDQKCSQGRDCPARRAASMPPLARAYLSLARCSWLGEGELVAAGLLLVSLGLVGAAAVVVRLFA